MRSQNFMVNCQVRNMGISLKIKRMKLWLYSLHFRTLSLKVMRPLLNCLISKEKLKGSQSSNACQKVNGTKQGIEPPVYILCMTKEEIEDILVSECLEDTSLCAVLDYAQSDASDTELVLITILVRG